MYFHERKISLLFTWLWKDNLTQGIDWGAKTSHWEIDRIMWFITVIMAWKINEFVSVLFKHFASLEWCNYPSHVWMNALWYGRFQRPAYCSSSCQKNKAFREEKQMSIKLFTMKIFLSKPNKAKQSWFHPSIRSYFPHLTFCCYVLSGLPLLSTSKCTWIAQSIVLHLQLYHLFITIRVRERCSLKKRRNMRLV